MNTSTAILLVNDNVRAVAVAYDSALDYAGKKQPRDVKTFKTIDADIKVDDLVVIPTDTRWGFTVGKVTAVDVDVNFDSHEVMRWIMQRIDTTYMDEVMKMESQMLAEVASADKAAKRKELADKLRANNPNIDNIPLLSMTKVHVNTEYKPEPAKRGGAQVPLEEVDIPSTPPSAYPDDIPY